MRERSLHDAAKRIGAGGCGLRRVRRRPASLRRPFVRWRTVLLALALAIACGYADAQSALRPNVEAFVRYMAAKYHFDPQALRKLFTGVQVRPDILRAMSNPGTALPWYAFRSRFVNQERIEAGVAFWRANAGALRRARERYGVPADIIVATLGIETDYGRRTGSVKVLDALTTLAFHYPRRAAYYTGELKDYLLLGRDLDWNLAAVRGSYAGAMGLPQFMPSSYRKYAVDFDHDGSRNLLNDPQDAIGSIANYYSSFGWRPGAPVVVPASLDQRAAARLRTGIRPKHTVRQFIAEGAKPRVAVPHDAKAALVMLQTEAGPAYWLGLHNFYVITRYNPSVNYAMAVYDLAREIRSQIELAAN